AERIGEFLAWVERTATLTRLLNPPAVVRWNSDKHYLAELAGQDLPVVPSRFCEPGEEPAAILEAFLAGRAEEELVVKPAVGAGSRDTHRHARAAVPEILAHMRTILGTRRSVLLQPY